MSFSTFKGRGRVERGSVLRLSTFDGQKKKCGGCEGTECVRERKEGEELTGKTEWRQRGSISYGMNYI